MTVRRLALLCLAVLVAGCTGPTDGGDGQPAANGLVIHQAAFTEEVAEGGSTQLVVRLRNTNPHPADDVALNLSNLPTSESVDVVDLIDTSIGRSDGDTCRFDTIPAADSQGPGTALCAWEFTIPPDAAEGPLTQQERTYPVGLRLAYRTKTSMQHSSLEYTFSDEFEGDISRTTTSTFGNGELSVTTTHQPHHRTGETSVTVDVTVQNTGPGDIVSGSGDVRTVGIGYDGSLVDGGNPFGTTSGCTTVNILPGDQQATLTCPMDGNVSAGPGTTYDLRLTASYRYAQYKEIPLTILDIDS